MDYLNFDREKLVTALVSVKPGLGKKDIIQQATKFIFKDKRIYTFNDEIAVSYPLEHELTGAVPSEEFYALLNKMDDAVVQICSEPGVLHIKGTKLSASLKVEDEIKLPMNEFAIISLGLWNAIPGNFVDALEFASISVGTDLAKPILTCVHWTSTFIESCDNFRLTRYDIATPNLKDPVLLSNKVAATLMTYNPKEFLIVPGMAHFKMGSVNDGTDCIFSCRIYSGTYVNLGPLFDRVHTQKIVFNDKLIALLDRLSVLAEKDIHGNSKAFMAVTSGMANIKTQSALGESDEETRILCDVDINFEFKIETLLHILKRYKIAHIDDTKKSLKFQKDNWTHIVSLC